jgi:hypothetical protein
MDFFIKNNYSAAQLHSLNACQVFLQVITVSDIRTADGTSLLQCILSGTRDVSRPFILKWPAQVNRGAKSWVLWRSAPSKLLQNNRLITPLGKWIKPTHQRWTWFTRPFSFLVYQIPIADPPPFYRPLRQEGRATRLNTKITTTSYPLIP